MVKLFLLESHCLSILLYASEGLNLPNCQMTEINSWWNSVYRKIFHYHKWESVRNLISLSGRIDLHHIVNLRTLKFLINMNQNPNTPASTMNYLRYHYNQSSEYTSLFTKFHCNNLCDLNLIKRCIYNDFHNSTQLLYSVFFYIYCFL